jgi:3-deoxy-D-manno-octulosonic-acid transferase
VILNIFLLGYRLLWVLLTPFVLLYLWRRGRRDPLYFTALGQRFGSYQRPLPQNPVWIHAVSLGETRSAVPLIRLLLDRGDPVVITNFTPAGQREAARQFAAEITAGQLAVIWVPFDMRWTYKRFFKACQPRIGLTMEVEIWPAMIFAAKAAGVPLFMCNAQYANKSMARDGRGFRLRQRVIQGFSGAFVKSELQAQRFRAIGLQNVVVTGELRFDQPIPPTQIEAALQARRLLAPGRRVITIASAVEGEDDLYLEAIQAVLRAAKAKAEIPPLFVYVPRAPERFDAIAESFEQNGLKIARRSKVFGPGNQGLMQLTLAQDGAPDILVGDSLGEMYFYLALSDLVVVGGGFTPRGAHNIIEPLAVLKPVVTGPSVWTIEYPFVEAQRAGVAQSLPDGAALIAALTQPVQADPEKILAFLSDHSGASRKTLAAIDRILN